MKVVVKKSILFNLLKSSLNESRSGHSFYSDGSFLGRFEEEEKEDFINPEVPLRASPKSSTQLHAKNFDVSDPDYSPASKSGFLAAAAAILEHVPDDQIDFAYEKLHKLLDETMEEEDKKNYGSINEILNTLILKESREFYLKKAIEKVRMGEDAISVAQDLIDMYDEFEGEDSFELSQKIEDMQYADAGFDMEQEADPIPVQQSTPAVQQLPGGVIRRRAKGSQRTPTASRKTPPTPSRIDPSLSEIEKIDITDLDDKQAIAAVAAEAIKGLGLLALCIETLEMKRSSIQMSNQFSEMQKAAMTKAIPHVKHNIQNYKTFFIYNYDTSSRKFSSMFRDKEELTSNAAHQIRVAYDHGVSFLEPPQAAEYIDIPDPIVSDYIPDDGTDTEDDLPYGESSLYNQASDKTQWLLGWNTGIMAGDRSESIPDMSDKHPDYAQGYERGHATGLSDSIYESVTRVQSVNSTISASLYRDRVIQFKIFKENIRNLQQKLGLSLDETILELAIDVADIMIDKVENLNYGTEKEKTDEALRNTFSGLVSYFDPNKGVGQKHDKTTKRYQANNSQNFFRNVKEEYREEIIDDFLKVLVKKYLKGSFYMIYAGRKDQDDPNKRRKEYYKIDPVKFAEMAEAYANKQIDIGLKQQASMSPGEEDLDGVDPEEPIAGGEVELDMAYELIKEEEATETRGFFKKYAKEFGFSGASGIRQWYIKKPDRLFRMMIESLKGNRVLADLHNQTLRTVLKIVADQLPDIAHTKIIKNKAVVDYDNHDPEKELLLYSESDIGTPPYEDVFERYVMKESVGDVQQALDHLKANKGELFSDIQVNSGGKEIPFLKSPGGRIIVNLNALIYDKFLVKFDKDFTDFVSNKLMNDKTILIEMENLLGTEPSITPKIAKSLAEYFTGKKEKPVLEKIRLVDEDGDAYEKFEFKKNEDGKYPNKGGAAKLLAQGIDGDTFNYLFNKVSTHLKDTALQSFKPTVEFEKQKKADILQNYKNSVVDKMLENFEEKGLKDQIHNAVRELVSFAR